VVELLVFGCFLQEAKKQRLPIIGRTCAFDAKIYKIVGGIFVVSLCMVWDKKFFKISDLGFQLPSLLVDF
jgi:hypothetical protein